MRDRSTGNTLLTCFSSDPEFLTFDTNETARQDYAGICAQQRLIGADHTGERVGRSFGTNMVDSRRYEWRSGVFHRDKDQSCVEGKDLAGMVVCNAQVACSSVLDNSLI
jgi:hypothetical protein